MNILLHQYTVERIQYNKQSNTINLTKLSYGTTTIELI